MFKAVHPKTKEEKVFRYLSEFSELRSKGWTAGESIDRAADRWSARKENPDELQKTTATKSVPRQT